MTSIAPSFHFQSMEELPLLLQKLCLRHSFCFPMIRHRPMLLYRHCCTSMGLKYKRISNIFGVGKLIGDGMNQIESRYRVRTSAISIACTNFVCTRSSSAQHLISYSEGAFCRRNSRKIHRIQFNWC